jgi:hypothetical protein
MILIWTTGYDFDLDGIPQLVPPQIVDLNINEVEIDPNDIDLDDLF